jgi:hypothetical protein
MRKFEKHFKFVALLPDKNYNSRVGHTRGFDCNWKLVYRIPNLVHIRWCRHLKSLSHERGWAKPVENLNTSPFKNDQSIDVNVSKINIAGQSL